MGDFTTAATLIFGGSGGGGPGIGPATGGFLPDLGFLPGEVVFVDEAGLVVARRWCWKQSAESTVNLDTRQVIITVEAQHAGGRADIQAALQDLVTLLTGSAGCEQGAAALASALPEPRIIGNG